MSGTPRWSGVLRRLGARRDDEGNALVLVLGSMMVLAMLSLSALAFTVASTKFARYDQDVTSAMSAAQSGVEDFISRMNRNDSYYATVDCTNLALKGPMSTANTCGWTTTTATGWLPVDPGRTAATDPYFHYSLDTSKAVTEGSVTVTVTGRAHGEYRTVQSAVGKGGSTDYVYYTDFESADPANVQAYTASEISAMNTSEKNACGINGYDNALYWYEGRSSQSCSEIQFASGDTLAGAVFTNDAVLANGPTFTKTFSTANPTCANATAVQSTWKYCLRQTGGTWSTANFSNLQPQYKSALYLGDTSGQFATYPGCHYFGSTRILFNADGTMTVWNKVANNGNVAPIATAPPAGSAPACGTILALDSVGGATVPVPDNMVVYAASNNAGTTFAQCDKDQLGGPSGATLPVGTFTKALVPSSGATYTYDLTMAETTKYCQQGNLYAEGVVKGRVTLAAAQSIVMVGDVVLAGGLNGADILGLVATNSVEAFHPWLGTISAYKPSTTWKWNTGSPNEDAPGAVSGWPRQFADPSGGTSVTGLQIMGSIQTLQHSFYVQQYKRGSSLGLLQVNGSIAQRWRGIVGTGSGSSSSTGYLKNYVYDTRLQYAAPPYFPRWVNAEWTQRYFGEISTPANLRT